MISSLRRFFVGAAVVALVTCVPGAILAGNLVTNGSFENTTSGANKFWGGSGTPGTQAVGWTGGDTAAFEPIQAIYSGTTATTTGALQFYQWGNAYVGYAYVGLWQASASPDGGNYFASDSDTYFSKPLSQRINNLVVGNIYELKFDYAAAQFRKFSTGEWSGATDSAWYFNLGSTSLVRGQNLAGIAHTPSLSIQSHGFSGWSTSVYSFTANAASEILSFLGSSDAAGLPPVALLDGVSLTDVTPPPVPEPSSFAILVTGIFGIATYGLRRRHQMA